MCANFKPVTFAQVQQFGLPEIPFDYVEEVYPGYERWIRKFEQHL